MSSSEKGIRFITKGPTVSPGGGSSCTWRQLETLKKSAFACGRRKAAT